MQQKTEILIAIENGARTSQDLVDVTGMDRQKVAAYLCRLMAAGVLKRKPLDREGLGGRRAYFYEVAA